MIFVQPAVASCNWVSPCGGGCGIMLLLLLMVKLQVLSSTGTYFLKDWHVIWPTSFHSILTPPLTTCLQLAYKSLSCRTSSSTPWPTITLQSPWLHFGNPRHGPRYRTEGGGVAVMNPDQCATHNNSSNGHPIIIPAGTIATHPSREVTCPMNDSASLFWSINITLVVIHVTFSSPGWVLLLSPLLLLRYGALIPNYYAFNIQWGCVPRAADTSHLPAQDYYAVRKKWH